jgi:hypothetical protein
MLPISTHTFLENCVWKSSFWGRERERERASSQEQLEPSEEFLASEREKKTELLGNSRLIILW